VGRYHSDVLLLPSSQPGNNVTTNVTTVSGLPMPDSSVQLQKENSPVATVPGSVLVQPLYQMAYDPPTRVIDDVGQCSVPALTHAGDSTVAPGPMLSANAAEARSTAPGASSLASVPRIGGGASSTPGPAAPSSTASVSSGSFH
jgi:hypothetical protein